VPAVREDIAEKVVMAVYPVPQMGRPVLVVLAAAEQIFVLLVLAGAELEF
jgi:hypothetical protein